MVGDVVGVGSMVIVTAVGLCVLVGNPVAGVGAAVRQCNSTNGRRVVGGDGAGEVNRMTCIMRLCNQFALTLAHSRKGRMTLHIHVTGGLW